MREKSALVAPSSLPLGLSRLGSVVFVQTHDVVELIQIGSCVVVIELAPDDLGRFIVGVPLVRGLVEDDVTVGVNVAVGVVLVRDAERQIETVEVCDLGLDCRDLSRVGTDAQEFSVREIVQSAPCPAGSESFEFAVLCELVTGQDVGSV